MQGQQARLAKPLCRTHHLPYSLRHFTCSITSLGRDRVMCVGCACPAWRARKLPKLPTLAAHVRALSLSLCLGLLSNREAGKAVRALAISLQFSEGRAGIAVWTYASDDTAIMDRVRVSQSML